MMLVCLGFSIVLGAIVLLDLAGEVRQIRLTDESLEIHRRFYGRRVIPRAEILGVLRARMLGNATLPHTRCVFIYRRGRDRPVCIPIEGQFDVGPGVLRDELTRGLGGVYSPPGFEDRFEDHLAEAERARKGDEFVWRVRRRKFGHVVTFLSVCVLACVPAIWSPFWSWYVEHFDALGGSMAMVLTLVLGIPVIWLGGEALMLIVGRPLEFRASKAGGSMRRTFGRRDTVPAGRILGVDWTIDQARAWQGAYIAVGRPGRHLWRLDARALGTRPEPLLAALVALYGRLIDPPDTSDRPAEQGKNTQDTQGSTGT